MDMFKFLSFILLGMCLLFGGCKKENPSVNSDSSMSRNYRMHFKRRASGESGCQNV